MNINNFSRTERAGSAITIPFKALYTLLSKINFMAIIIGFGMAGWLFGMYMDWSSTLSIFASALVGTFFAGLFMLDAAEQYGPWFTFWLVITGMSLFFFKGGVEKTTFEMAEKVYMKDAVLNGNQIEYMGGDEMTKVIKLSDSSIVAHYNRFKDTDRFKAVINGSSTTNIILDYIGINHPYKIKKWITLHDIVADKSLFRIK